MLNRPHRPVPAPWAASDRCRTGERLQAALAGLRELEVVKERQRDLVRRALGSDSSPSQSGAEEQRLEATLNALKEQLSHLRKQDVGLKVHLQHLDQQISELKLDVSKASSEQLESDSRPSSGFYELSDAGSCSLSNSCASMYSNSTLSSQGSLLHSSRPDQTKGSRPEIRPRSADETTVQAAAFTRQGPGKRPGSGIRTTAEPVLPSSNGRQGLFRQRPVSTGDLERFVSLPKEPDVKGLHAADPMDWKYQCDLVSKNSGDVYNYPSPLHAVALQSPLFRLSTKVKIKCSPAATPESNPVALEAGPGSLNQQPNPKEINRPNVSCGPEVNAAVCEKEVPGPGETMEDNRITLQVYGPPEMISALRQNGNWQSAGHQGETVAKGELGCQEADGSVNISASTILSGGGATAVSSSWQFRPMAKGLITTSSCSGLPTVCGVGSCLGLSTAHGAGSCPGLPAAHGAGSCPGLPAAHGAGSCPGLPAAHGAGSCPGLPAAHGASSCPGLPAAHGAGSCPGLPAAHGAGSCPGLPAAHGAGSCPGLPAAHGAGSCPGLPAAHGAGSCPGLPAAHGAGSCPGLSMAYGAGSCLGLPTGCESGFCTGLVARQLINKDAVSPGTISVHRTGQGMMGPCVQNLPGDGFVQAQFVAPDSWQWIQMCPGGVKVTKIKKKGGRNGVRPLAGAGATLDAVAEGSHGHRGCSSLPGHPCQGCPDFWCSPLCRDPAPEDEKRGTGQSGCETPPCRRSCRPGQRHRVGRPDRLPGPGPCRQRGPRLQFLTRGDTDRALQPASPFHPTTDELSDHTADRFGDAESSGSEHRTPGPTPGQAGGSRRSEARICRIKASRALKKKIRKFQPEALQVMTTV
ncbi:dapper homolog 2-like [Narcine bancroftii]|uniref:dapper homolog 2-like n=1 Tax=Narcine bancroftii TaxID=1343680 RepID=UPI00383152E5